MKTKNLVGMILETVIKGGVLILIILFVYRTAITAYDFGFRVFAEEPVSVSGGRTITVSVAEDYTVKGMAKMLAEKGLIRDANLFMVQEFFSEFHGKIKPGIYDLSTAMTADEMMAVMAAGTDEDAE